MQEPVHLSLYIILCVADLSDILDLVAGEVGVEARVDVVICTSLSI